MTGFPKIARKRFTERGTILVLVSLLIASSILMGPMEVNAFAKRFSDGAVIEYFPTSGPPGTVVTISGTGLKFYPDVEDLIVAIVFKADYQFGGNPTFLDYADVTEDGAFSAQVEIPDELCNKPQILVQTPPLINTVWAQGVYALDFDVRPATRIHGTAYLPAGTIYPDSPQKALPFIRVGIKYRNSPSEEWVTSTPDTYTDENGNYEFQINLEKNAEVNVTLYFEDKFDGTNYFKLLDNARATTIPGRLETAAVSRTVTITESELGEKEVNLTLGKVLSPQEYSSESDLELISHFGFFYLLNHQAVKYAKEILGADISTVGGKMVLPVKVVLNIHGGCEYDSSETRVNIDRQVTADSQSPAEVPSGEVSPGNVSEDLFHEWGHHIMYSQFSIDKYLQGENHGGFLNPNTADSLSEGEAGFLAVSMNQFYGWQKGQVMYKLLGYESNWLAYEMRDKQSCEEEAVGSLLWDLVDNTPDEPLTKQAYNKQAAATDTISIPIKDLFKILRLESTHTVYALYEALHNAYPDLRDGLDRLFIEHGFFADRVPGDGIYNPPLGVEGAQFCGEPAKWTPNGAVEYYQDLSYGHRKAPLTDIYGQVYVVGDTIGAAANYKRADPADLRKTTPLFNGSFILMQNSEINTYLIDVKFEDNLDFFNYKFEEESVNGLLYFVMPPSCYSVVATITPVSKDYIAEKPLTITSAEYFASLNGSESHFLTHQFTLKKTGMFILPISSELFWLILIIIVSASVSISILLFLNRRRGKHVETTLPPPPPTPILKPATSQVPSNPDWRCPTCGGPIQYIPQNGRWYCDREQKFLDSF